MQNQSLSFKITSGLQDIQMPTLLEQAQGLVLKHHENRVSRNLLSMFLIYLSIFFYFCLKTNE